MTGRGVHSQTYCEVAFVFETPSFLLWGFLSHSVSLPPLSGGLGFDFHRPTKPMLMLSHGAVPVANDKCGLCTGVQAALVCAAQQPRDWCGVWHSG